jgi:hypothetical protein
MSSQEQKAAIAEAKKQVEQLASQIIRQGMNLALPYDDTNKVAAESY